MINLHTLRFLAKRLKTFTTSCSRIFTQFDIIKERTNCAVNQYLFLNFYKKKNTKYTEKYTSKQCLA